MTHALGNIKICCMDTAYGALTALPVKKVCIVTRFFMSVSGAAGGMKKAFENAGMDCTLFDRVEPNLSPAVIKQGILCMDERTDLIVALGSGTVTDAAKAMLFFRQKALNAKFKPLLVVIPSFFGTGSEIAATSTITDPETRIRLPLTDAVMKPDLILLDARLTRTIPAPVMASTGMAVLARCIEAYVSKRSNGTADSALETAIVYVFTYLVRSIACPADTMARQRMLLAACLSGMAIHNSGLGIGHSLACALHKNFDLSRENAQALVLDPVVRFNQDHAKKKYAALSRRLGLPGTTDEQGARSLVYAIEWLKKKSGAPVTIADLGIDISLYASCVKSMAQTALDDPVTRQNPGLPTRADLEMLLRQLY